VELSQLFGIWAVYTISKPDFAASGRSIFLSHADTHGNTDGAIARALAQSLLFVNDDARLMLKHLGYGLRGEAGQLRDLATV
jgi:hypothetical protein